MSGLRRGLLRALPHGVAILASFALVVAAPAAFAQTAGSVSSAPAVALVWSGPGPELTCLGEEGLTRAVSEYLGRQPFASGSVDQLLRVTVERLPDRTWRARLESQDLSGAVLGSRELASDGTLCSSLDEPLVLAVALMVDSEPEPPPPPAPPPKVEEPAVEASPPAPARPPPPASHAWELGLDGSVAAEAGLLPAASLGLELGIELRAASWLSARANAGGFLPVAASLTGSALVRFGLLYGALAICPGFAPASALRLSLCGGALYGSLSANSRGFDANRSTSRWVFAGMLGPRASVHLGKRWFGVAELAGVVPYHPDRFVYELNGVRLEVFRMSELSLLATLGVAVMF